MKKHLSNAAEHQNEQKRQHFVNICTNFFDWEAYLSVHCIRHAYIDSLLYFIHSIFCPQIIGICFLQLPALLNSVALFMPEAIPNISQESEDEVDNKGITLTFCVVVASWVISSFIDLCNTYLFFSYAFVLSVHQLAYLCWITGVKAKNEHVLYNTM